VRQAATARRALALVMLGLAAAGDLNAADLRALPADRPAAAAPLRIVASTTDLKSLAEQVAGQRAQVIALVPAGIDAEDYQPRPHDLSRLQEARLLLRVGADYDLWLERLVPRSGNPAIARGAPGDVDCSAGIALLEIRGLQAGAAGGHAHGSGNPHYWLDPGNAAVITATLRDALVRADPAGADPYERARTAFLERLEGAMRRWEAQLAPARGQPLIAFHGNWAYFARRFRLRIAATIEPRPGVPPAASELAVLVRLAQDGKVRAVIRQPFEPERDAAFVAQHAGAQVVVLAGSVGAVPQASDYFALFDYDVAALAGVFR